METIKLYQQDVYTREWEAAVTSLRPAESGGDSVLVTLDRTAFFPEGGGQSCDTGTVSGIPVTDVQEYGGEVYHAVPADAADALSPGTAVSCSIDWERRFDNMQRHCGEHIMSGMLHRFFGGVNRGFHMGAGYMTIDIALEDMPEVTELTYEDVRKAEYEANRVIWSNAPVKVFRFDTREEAEKLPLRKALAFDEDISIVMIGDEDDPADCVACCGTHPAYAGQVGIIKVYKLERYKDMYRITMEAGQRAFRDYQMKHDILTDLSNAHSSSIEELPDAIRAGERKASETRDELYHIRKALIAMECAALDSIIEQTSEPVISYSLADLSTDDAFTMAKHYIGKTAVPVMLYSEKDTSFVLASDGKTGCGKIVKDLISGFGGKGGGGKTSARAMFTEKENAQAFAHAVKEYLSR